LAKSLDGRGLLFDPRELVENCGNKRELAEKVLRAYLRVSPDLIAKIKSGLDSGNADEIRLGSHTLRGSSATIGARPLAEVCRRIEEALPNEARKFLHELLAKFDQTVREVRAFLGETS
jgi:HPt (histidine-containing phosphotransfer) domain-containing protein